MNEKKKIFSGSFWENFILGVIVLVIIQTFLDDYSNYAHWSISARNFLLITGFIFDLIFTIEFTIRTVIAVKKKELKQYLFYRRGWIDFLASLPLLLLNSGPSLYFLLTGSLAIGKNFIGVLNVLKVVKAIRVTRILRLIRIMKIFGKIHNAESKMAQRHISTIATIGVFTVVSVLLVFSFIKINSTEKLYNSKKIHYTKLIKNIEKVNTDMDVPLKILTFNILSNDYSVLKCYFDDFLIFSNIADDKFEKYYSYEDIMVINKGDFVLYIDVSEITKETAAINIQNFFIIIMLVIGYMIFYTKHFVQTISDVAYIMYRGMKEDKYNLQVKIKEEYKDDEIFKLAELYNEKWLPMKIKLQDENKAKKESNLSINDLLNFKI